MARRVSVFASGSVSVMGATVVSINTTWSVDKMVSFVVTVRFAYRMTYPAVEEIVPVTDSVPATVSFPAMVAFPAIAVVTQIMSNVLVVKSRLA